MSWAHSEPLARPVGPQLHCYSQYHTYWLHTQNSLAVLRVETKLGACLTSDMGRLPFLNFILQTYEYNIAYLAYS